MRNLICLLLAPALFAQDDLDIRKANIMSEGTRMSAELFALKTRAGSKLPTIVMSHGWGGTVAALRRDAVVFARAGYLVLAFDYRGWGASDSRVALTAPAPAVKPDRTFTAEVREVREVVDPMDMTADLANAIHWVHGEPQCDTARIGLWGSSFSGGLVVWAAARDPRVKAIFSQVGALDGRWVVQSENDRKLTYEESTRRARGEIGYPAPGVRAIGNLRGAPIRSRFIPYSPVDDVEKTKCAMMFVIAEEEELFDNKDHGLLAYARAKGPRKLVTVPNITHYGIYTEAREKAQQLAVEWFDAQLR